MIPRRAGVDDPQSRVYRSALGRGAFWKTFPLTAVAFVFSQPQTAPWGWAGSVAIMAGVAALAAWFLLGTTYRVENGTLVLQQLYRRVDIPLTRITAVRPRTAASPRRGPSWPGYFANGTAHIEIGDTVWTVLVSPRDEAAFLAERAAQRQAAATSGRGAERPPGVLPRRDPQTPPAVPDDRSDPRAHWPVHGRIRKAGCSPPLGLAPHRPGHDHTGVDRIDYASFWTYDTPGNDFALGTSSGGAA